MDAFAVPLTSWDVALFVVGAVGFGLAVSWLATTDVRRRFTAHLRSAADSSVDWLEASLAGGSNVPDVWHAMVNATAATLARVDVSVTPAGSSSLPVISRRSPHPAAGSDIVVIPRSGAVVEFVDPRLRSEIVLTPARNETAVEVPRRAVLAFADMLESLAAGRIVGTV